ncbi:tyrosine-type recombinase/integrase, partial [Nitrolancea hollandica]|uniref:tyrosine-type recombinase/integrase n=1 Tax=Nitrolancea hollandica TaxID=1206749 RepID=UPI00058D67CA
MAQAEKRSGSYSTRVSLTDPLTGERTQKRVTARTKRELDTKVAQIKASWHAGSYIEPSNEPFGSYLRHYLETADMAPNTRKSYAGVVRRIIVPSIGAVPLGKLSGRHVQELYNAVRDSSYAVQVQAVVSGAMKLALREGVIGRNVADGLVVARSERDEPRAPDAWTPEELSRFLEGVRDHWLFPPFWTAAHTGMRLSELIGLRWDDISLDLGRLFVGKSKTKSGRRRIALDAGTIAVLRAHRDDQDQRRCL